MGFTGNIYYVTRTWPHRENSNNCGLLRHVYADALRELGPVTVVTPEYECRREKATHELLAFPVQKASIKICGKLQKMGIMEDSLDLWVKKCISRLSQLVTKNDLIFAVSGGELACIKIGAILKEKIGCRFAINFRDPIDGEMIHGEMLPGYIGVSRQKAVKHYVSRADAMITSCDTYRQYLCNCYPEKAKYIENHLCGYIEKIPSVEMRRGHTPLRIVYAGATSCIQNTEILYHALKGDSRVQLVFICADFKERKKYMTEPNVFCLPLMPHNEFLHYMQTNADIGFLSLTSAYAGNCLPSKLYEYINLGLPILASLPDGQAKNLIQERGYGIVCNDGDISSLRDAVTLLLEPARYAAFCRTINEEHENWACENRIPQFVRIMKRVLEVT